MRLTANRGRTAGGRRLAALALGVGLVSALGAPPATSFAAQTTATTAHIRMHDIAFLPQSITVSPGTTIVWNNDDDMVHTVTSGDNHDDGVWVSSSSIPPGGTFRVTLNKPGTYHYYCKPHMYSAAMHATIVVEPAAH